ncbi:hypothetical protein SAMN00777080_2853 [Aquiflexum balticum DSM 16537]|uniref:Uncharacterized protein n=2 Tax=Aquiflexum TaxID=280472 RepID=A0A1W2H5N2_9BACT|nr:hypothetical protein SAMN00777080_2853 [Aquiflexum balticum DSM 16537]
MYLTTFEMSIAQQALKGKIIDYADGKGLIISHDIVTGYKYTWGTIDEEGMITVPLSDSFLDEIKKMAAKAQKKAPRGFTLKLPTVEDTFTCRYPDIEFENPQSLLSGLPDLILSDNKRKAENGKVYAVNNPLIANWLHRNQKGDVGLGYYLMFYFSEDKASAIGTCMTSNYTGLGDENFDKSMLYGLELEKGWNIVQYEIEKVFESKNGGFFPEVIKVTKLDNLPDDLTWVRVY